MSSRRGRGLCSRTLRRRFRTRDLCASRVSGVHSRFADFVYGVQRVKAYARKLVFQLDPPHYVGHNPLGGWMVLLLLAAAFLAATSGLYAGDEEARGPLAHVGGLGGAFGALHLASVRARSPANGPWSGRDAPSRSPAASLCWPH